MPLVAPVRCFDDDIEERRSSKYAAGRTSIDSNGAPIMPPTIGEAMAA
jgi:hypothetical protein